MLFIFLHIFKDDLIDRVLTEKNICIKLTYEQMRYYPELLAELKMALDMLKQKLSFYDNYFMIVFA